MTAPPPLSLSLPADSIGTRVAPAQGAARTAAPLGALVPAAADLRPCFRVAVLLLALFASVRLVRGRARVVVWWGAVWAPGKPPRRHEGAVVSGGVGVGGVGGASAQDNSEEEEREEEEEGGVFVPGVGLVVDGVVPPPPRRLSRRERKRRNAALRAAGFKLLGE